jgi:predicted dehydrogenase
MTQPLRLGLVGAGAWGELVARQARRSRHTVVVGVADARLQAAEAAAARLGAEVWPEVEGLMADARIEAVAIAVPNDLHHSMAITALELGKHVLLEKPMALTVKDADAITEVARRAGRVLAVSHIQRHFAPLVHLKRLVDAGTLGEVVAVSVSRRDHLHRTKSWLQQKRHVGGLLYQSACHEYDLMCWLCGEVAEISCVAGDRVIADDTLDYPDTILSQLRFRNGVVGQVWNCMTDPLMGYTGVVTGTEGSASFDLYDARVQLRRFGEDLREERFEPADGWSPHAWITSGDLGQGEADALGAMLADFARAVRSRTAAASTSIDGARAVELAQGGYLSIAERRPVALPLSGDDRGRRTYLESAAAPA